MSSTQHILEIRADPKRQELHVYSRKIKPQGELPIMEPHY